MDLLDASEERAHVGDAEATAGDETDAHGYLVDAPLLGGAVALAESAESDVALLTGSDSDDDDDTAAFQPLPLRTPLRRRVGKALQLALLRKYVQSAKELGRVPDRAATEQLLDEGFDEFYFNGGNLNEPRMSYAAFLKLVRNRRGEVLRGRRHGESERTMQKKHNKERHEIRALVDELERVRQAHATRESTQETPPSAAAPSSSDAESGELVLVSKRKLQRLLRATRETLASQTRLLEQVQSLERQLLHHAPPPAGD